MKWKFFLYPCCLSIKLRLIVMSTILKCRERQRQRKRESRRQASEAHRGKKWVKNKGDEFHLKSEEEHENFVAVVRKRKMLTDSKVKMRTGIQATKFFVSAYNIFAIKRITWKFIYNNSDNSATTAAKKCTKKYPAGAQLFFSKLDLLIFCRSRCRHRLALHDVIFWVNWKWY